MWHVTLRFVSERMLVNVEMIVEHEVEDILPQVRCRTYYPRQQNASTCVFGNPYLCVKSRATVAFFLALLRPTTVCRVDELLNHCN